MGCKVLYLSVALFLCVMKRLHVKAQCSKPNFGENVVLSDEHILTDRFDNGVVVTFECIPGYKPVNFKASKSVTCVGKQWTNLELTCQRKSCGSPRDIVNGRYDIPEGILFGDTIKVVCNKGYERFGPAQRTCRAEGIWDGRDPDCEAVKCLSPLEIINGQIQEEYMSVVFNFGEGVSYKCNSGFSLVGKAEVVCSEDGAFHPEPPKCVEGCEKPNIQHAIRIGGRSPPYKLGNFIDYKCEERYDMLGESHIVCTENGWSPKPPQCIGHCGPPVFGGHVVISEPFLSKTKFPDGSNVTFECLSGYKTVDSKASNSVTCVDTKWTELNLTCKVLNCGQPAFGGHVVISKPFDSETKFLDGSNVTFECLSGYKPIDSQASNLVTCVDTKWTELKLKCKGYCGHPAFGKNVIMSKQLDSVHTFPDGTKLFPDGTKLEFECISGFKPVDSKASNSVTCLDIKWTELKLTCQVSNGGMIAAIICSVAGLAVIIAAVIYFLKKKSSKHEYPQKVATSNEEGEL